MSLTSRLLGIRAALPVPVDRTPTAATGTTGYAMPGAPQTPRWNADNATAVGYYGHVYAYRCARTIASTIAGLPFRAGRDAGHPGVFDVNAPLARLLGPPPGGPAPSISPRRLWTWSIVSYLVTGRYGWETPTDPRTGRVTALWPLVGGRLKPIPTAGGAEFFSGYEYWLNAQIRKLGLQQVFYSWRPAQDDWREPESVLQAASLPLSTAIALDKHMFAFMKNNMVGAKMVLTPSFEDGGMRRAFQDQFLSEMTGWDNAGRTAFAEWEDDGTGKQPSVQVVDLSTKPVDVQTIEQIRELKHDICVAFGVPVSMLGDASDRTYNNADQEHRNYWTGTILPLLHELADDVNITLAPRLGAEVGWFDIGGVEALKPSRRFQDADPVSLMQAGVILPAEYREDRDLAPELPKDPNAPIVNPEPAVDDTPGASVGGMGRRDTATGSRLTAKVHAYLSASYPERVLGWVDDADWTFDPAVPLDEIKMARRPGGRDPAKVAGIADAVKAGKAMDPVVLVDTGEGRYEIADGYHRTLAFDRAGRKTIPAFIASGVDPHGEWERAMHDAKRNRSAGDRTFDEAKHPRQHGKFATVAGGDGPPAPVAGNIKAFQAAHGLPQTGRFDDATVAKIHEVLTAKTGRHSGKGAKKQALARRKTTVGSRVKPLTPAQQGLATHLHVHREASLDDIDWDNELAGVRYDVTPLGEGKNWVTNVGGLPLFVRAIAHALIRNGHSESNAIQLALGVVKNWASGRGKVTAKTRAKAAAALAEWERKKAQAHATRDALTETSSAGALLPTAGTPMAPVPQQTHLPVRGSTRGICARCGEPASAKVHRLPGRRRRRGTRHAGEGHAPVRTGHTSHARNQQLAAVHREADQLEPGITRVMTDLFAAQQKATLDRLNGKRGRQMLRAATPPEPPADGTTPTDDSAPAPTVDAAQVFDLTHWAERTRQVLDPLFTAVSTMVGDRLGRQFGDDATQNSLGAVQVALNRRLQRLADTLTRTTFDQVAQVLRTGVADGQTVGQMTAALGRVFDDAQTNRAPMIARTEAIGSLNEAAHTYATQAGPHVVAGKEWLSAHDHRVRHTHREADGQIRSIGRPFHVGSSEMGYPHDPAAPPSETVNCRCTVAFLTPAEYAKNTEPAQIAA